MWLAWLLLILLRQCNSVNELNGAEGNGDLFCPLSSGLSILIYLGYSGEVVGSAVGELPKRQEVGRMAQQVPLYSEHGPVMGECTSS